MMEIDLAEDDRTLDDRFGTALQVTEEVKLNEGDRVTKVVDVAESVTSSGLRHLVVEEMTKMRKASYHV